VHDDLLTPTIPPQRPGTTAPWSLEGQLLASILLGPLAAGVLAAINGGRLGIRPLLRVAMLAAGLAGVAVRAVLTASVLPDGNPSSRLAANVLGGLVWLVVHRLLRTRLRAYAIGGGETRSMWRDGVWIGLGCAVVEAIAVVVAT